MSNTLLELEENIEEEKTTYTAASILEEKPYKVIYVFSSFMEYQQEQKGYCCKKKTITTTSDCKIDGVQLADRLSDALDTLYMEKYTLHSITPINGGDYKTTVDYGAGWTYTQGLMVVGMKNSE